MTPNSIKPITSRELDRIRNTDLWVRIVAMENSIDDRKTAKQIFEYWRKVNNLNIKTPFKALYDLKI